MTTNRCKTGCPKVERKEFVAEVVIRSHGKKPLPDFGLGKGVLARDEVVFTDERGRGFDSPMFEISMLETGRKLMEETVEVRWREKSK